MGSFTFVALRSPGTSPRQAALHALRFSSALDFGTRKVGDNDAPWSGKALSLAKTILAKKTWTSADLEEDNAFTVSYLLEALADLQAVDDQVVLADTTNNIESHVKALVDDVMKGEGVAIDEYPPTAFLSQKVLRVIARWNNLTPEVCDKVREWIWPKLYEESVAVASRRADADVVELGYAVLVASQVTKLADMTPRQRTAVEYALGQFFDAQDPDNGSWPRSQPLFHYKKWGHGLLLRL